MSLSTHVLDTARGIPAAGVDIVVERHTGDGWTEVARGTTDADGRIGDLLTDTPAGHHRLRVDTGGWYAARDEATFWPEVVVTFHVTDPAAHHHVPLLLSPYGYSTYRGS